MSTTVKATALLVCRLAHYYHRNPINQLDCGMGASSSALYKLVTNTLDGDVINRSHYYRVPKYYLFHCMNCGSQGKNTVPSRHFFTKECVHCYECDGDTAIRDDVLSTESSKYFNPLVETFDMLDLLLRKEIIKYLFDIGTHPIYNSPHSERG